MATVCNICTRPADDGYVNAAAGERCVDPCHEAPAYQTYFVYGAGNLWHPVREPHATRAGARDHVRRCTAQLTDAELAEGDHYFYRVARVAEAV